MPTMPTIAQREAQRRAEALEAFDIFRAKLDAARTDPQAMADARDFRARYSADIDRGQAIREQETRSKESAVHDLRTQVFLANGDITKAEQEAEVARRKANDKIGEASRLDAGPGTWGHRQAGIIRDEVNGLLLRAQERTKAAEALKARRDGLLAEIAALTAE